MGTTMRTPIILTAFGTSPAARATCQHIETAVKKQFPDHNIYWGYNARTVAHELRKNSDTDIRRPIDLLRDLAEDGCPSAIVQSLHLVPGQEFHCLHREVRQIDTIHCRLGLPLLSSPPDYATILDLLGPLILRHPQRAVLLVGHGTRHPVWPVYLALENLLQRRFGPRVFMGVVEHYPDTTGVEERIIAAGYREVLMIPFFLVAGMHYRRDMMGDGEHSWRSRLLHRGLQVEPINEGIGLLPGIGDLVVGHIKEAGKHC